MDVEEGIEGREHELGVDDRLSVELGHVDEVVGSHLGKIVLAVLVLGDLVYEGEQVLDVLKILHEEDVGLQNEEDLH